MLPIKVKAKVTGTSSAEYNYEEKNHRATWISLCKMGS